MYSNPNLDNDHRKSRSSGAVEQGRSLAHSKEGLTVSFSGLMRSEGIHASYNLPLRAQAITQMQQTHGNRAVQRSVGVNGQAGYTPIQREALEVENPWEEFDPDEAMRNLEAYTTPPAVKATEGPVLGPSALPMHPFGIPPQSASEVWGDPGGSMAQSEPARVPPAPPIQNTDSGMEGWMSDWWKRYGNVGDFNNVVDTGATAVEMMTMTKAAKSMADASELAQIGSGAGKVGGAANVLGVGMGLNNFINANDNYERVQAGADTVASGIGFLGPLGSAFSGGYSAGQLLNKTFGLSDKLSDVLLDWDPLGLKDNEQSWSKREEAVLRERIIRKHADRKRDAAFQQEIDQSMKIARGEAAPYTPMLQTPSVPINYDEEGNALPPVSMRLP